MKNLLIALALGTLGAAAHAQGSTSAPDISSMDAKKRSAFCGGALASAAEMFYTRGEKDKAEQVARKALRFWPSSEETETPPTHVDGGLNRNTTRFSAWERKSSWGALEVFGGKAVGQTLSSCANFADTRIPAAERELADMYFAEWYLRLTEGKVDRLN